MKTKFLYVWICIFWSISSIAQIDTAQKIISLKEVVIQPLLSVNQKDRRQPADVHTTTEKILTSIPGLTLISRGNFAQEPTIRGLNAGQISQTIDGMHIFGACTDRMDPINSYIEPNNLQKISVGFGYGSHVNQNGGGGGIDYKLKQATLSTNPSWKKLVGIGIETNAMAKNILSAINRSTKTYGFTLSGIFRQAGNYTAAEKETVLYSSYKKWNISLASILRLNDKQNLLLHVIRDEGYDIGYPSLLMDVKFAKATILSLSHEYKNLNNSLAIQSKLYANSINHAMDDTKRPASQVPIHMDMPGKSTTMGAYTQAKYRFKSHSLSVKLEGYTNKLHAEMTMYPNNASPMYMLTIPDAQRILFNASVSDKLNLNTKWSVLISAQSQVSSSFIFSQQGKKTLSSINAESLNHAQALINVSIQPVLKFNDRYEAFIHIAKASRLPTLQEMYGFYLFNRLDAYDYLGNPAIKIEKMYQFSTGINITSKTLSADWQTFFYYMPDYIVGVQKNGFSVMTIGAKGVKQYQHIKYAVLYGSELNLKIRLSPIFYFSSNYSYSYGKDYIGSGLPMISPFKSSTQMNAHVLGAILTLEGQFAAAQRNVDEIKYGEQPSKAYTLLHFKAGKKFIWSKNELYINMGVNNVFDTYFSDHLSVQKIPGQGRSFFTHFSMGF